MSLRVALTFFYSGHSSSKRSEAASMAVVPIDLNELRLIYRQVRRNVRECRHFWQMDVCYPGGLCLLNVGDMRWTERSMVTFVPEEFVPVRDGSYAATLRANAFSFHWIFDCGSFKDIDTSRIPWSKLSEWIRMAKHGVLC